MFEARKTCLTEPRAPRKYITNNKKGEWLKQINFWSRFNNEGNSKLPRSNYVEGHYLASPYLPF